MNSDPHYFIGIDIGTSGIRACAVDDSAQLHAMASATLPPPIQNGRAIEQDAMLWWQTLQQVLHTLLQKIDASRVRALCVDGTSGTMLVTDAQGTPLAPALMYNDSRCIEQAERIKTHAPVECAAHGASSGLAKLLYLQQTYPQARHALHQADWIAGTFCARFDSSDENNALKTGYDAQRRCWPDWLDQLKVNRTVLPNVVAPGTAIGTLTPHWAQYFHLPADTKLVAGTTDSIAAFIATGATQPGEAVTSLGSTLVLKIICDKPIYAPQYGIYSHRLGDYWLAGGASNSGGAVLKKYFNESQLSALTPQLQPQHPTGLDYYPLLTPGERFPLNDASLQPRLEPRPADDVEFFQGMLEAMTRIEYEGYRKLQQLGAPWPQKILTAGGGSINQAWMQMRRQLLQAPVSRAEHADACYGAAILAMHPTGTAKQS
jgi:sugar (pentulose or hexulose) kinase